MIKDCNSPASHFGAKADSYKSKAVTQLEIAGELSQHIESSHCGMNGFWLDLGSGPAVMESSLYSRYPSIKPILLDISINTLEKAFENTTSISAVCADMDRLPFVPDTVDAVVASSSIQWSRNITHLIESIRAVLKKSGTLALALFTEGTLDNLRRTQEKFNLPQPVQFCSHNKMKKLLQKSGFEILHETQTTKTELYSSGIEAIKAISGIGATHHSGKKLSPGELRQFISFLESQSDTPHIHKNIYEVSYFIAKVTA